MTTHRPPVLPLFILVIFISLGVPPIFAGEPQWEEVRSPHFSVITDGGEKRGREVAMRFEQMRAVFGAIMTKANVNLPTPLQIVAFRNTKEMRQVAPLFNGKPTQVAGLFQAAPDRGFIMLDLSVEDPWVVVFHEYAHQLMNGNLQEQFDPWFEEGFAEYFSSIEVDGKEARVGKIPKDEYTILQQVGMMRIADLFRVRQNSQTYNESGDHRTTFYAESGMLMHYIYDNQLLPKVGNYFDLKENKHVAVEDAIQQAFGMSSPQFDKVLRSYISSGHYRYYPIPNPANISSNTYTVLPMSATSANAALADIHLHSRDYQERAVSEFQEILKSDPNNPAACRGLGYAYLQKRDFAQAGEYFRRASQLDSKDPRVHYYSALLTARENNFGNSADTAEMTKELETSISLDPNFADSYALLSFTQSISGDSATALVNMRKALAISPRNETYLLNLASLYLQNRQTEQGIKVLQALQNSENPEVASRASAMAAQAQQMQMMTGSMANQPVMLTSPADAEHAQAAGPAEVQSARPAVTKFVQGILTKVDCTTPPSAILTVTSGTKTLMLRVADKNHVTLIGTDQFSCSWGARKVAVNYRESADTEGSVVSLEIQR